MYDATMDDTCRALTSFRNMEGVPRDQKPPGRVLARRRAALEFLPLLAGDPGLSQDADKEFTTYYGEQKVLDTWSRRRVLDMLFLEVVADHLGSPLDASET